MKRQRSEPGPLSALSAPGRGVWSAWLMGG